MLKSAIIVEGYPAVFPNVDMSTRVNIPVKKRLKRFDTTMDAFPDPRGVLKCGTLWAEWSASNLIGCLRVKLV